MASVGDFKDFGPLVGAIDQGTSSSRFLVSGTVLFGEKRRPVIRVFGLAAF